MKLKELKIFVKECDNPKFKSTIGWRATYDGNLYGDQIHHTLTSEDELVECINLFLRQAIGCIETLESESTADVVEVRCGHWIENEDDFWVMCSECGTEFLDDQIGIVDTYKYCPNCGAKMDG